MDSVSSLRRRYFRCTARNRSSMTTPPTTRCVCRSRGRPRHARSRPSASAGRRSSWGWMIGGTRRKVCHDELCDRGPGGHCRLLSGLVAGNDPAGRMDEQELLVTMILLLVAGHETTVNLITNGMLTLLHHPDVLDRLR